MNFEKCLQSFISYFNIQIEIQKVYSKQKDTIINDVLIICSQEYVFQQNDENVKYVIGLNVETISSQDSIDLSVKAAFLPRLKTVKNACFRNSFIQYLFAPLLQNIEDAGFDEAQIEEIFCPIVTEVERISFYNTKVKSIYLYAIQHIKGAIFMESQVANVYAPNLLQLNVPSFYYAFHNAQLQNLFCKSTVQCMNPVDCEKYGKCPFCDPSQNIVCEDLLSFEEFSNRFGSYKITMTLLTESNLLNYVNNWLDFEQRHKKVLVHIKQNKLLNRQQNAVKSQYLKTNQTIKQLLDFLEEFSVKQHETIEFDGNE